MLKSNEYCLTMVECMKCPHDCNSCCSSCDKFITWVCPHRKMKIACGKRFKSCKPRTTKICIELLLHVL
ncbi:hypothetical protein Anas_02785 [Armadillidium nasatum]|uniref:Uncharacterized protein n=1 Tax=Armadillidium nasatum TaxID=96803 RepID=A0A5N5SRC8_9CRUS|nr:hypothetical protein Anas_02785 [Armadillidium nasatum]